MQFYSLKFFTFILTVLFCSFFANGQAKNIKIPLELQKKSQSRVSQTLLEVKSNETEKSGKTSNGLLIFVKKDENDSFNIRIDVNRNNNLADDKAFKLKIAESKIIEIAGSTKKHLNSFELSLSNYKDSIYFSWKSNFEAKGVLKLSKCNSDIYLQDLNANGIFEFDEQGTNLQIDRNTDGKIWGKDEHLYSTEIIDFCGKNYLVKVISKTGNYLTLQETNLKIVKLNEKAPDFEFKSISGKPLSSNEFKGKMYLIDFWAVWCAVCIAKMPEIKELQGKLPILFVNTDNINRKQTALKIIAKHGIKETSVMRIFNNVDLFYKSYQRIELGLPFYILVDKEGFIRYGGNGGENLTDLKKGIAEIEAK